MARIAVIPGDGIGIEVTAERALIETPIRECITEDQRTPDLGGKLGTREAEDAVCRRLRTSSL